jgi:hypothetical protein
MTHVAKTAQGTKRNATVAGLAHEPRRHRQLHQVESKIQHMSRPEDGEDDITVTAHLNKGRNTKGKPKDFESGFGSKRRRPEIVQLSDNEADDKSPRLQPAQLDPYDSLDEVVHQVNKSKEPQTDHPRFSKKEQTEADEQLARELQDNERRKSARIRTRYGKQTTMVELKSAMSAAPETMRRIRKDGALNEPPTHGIKRSRETHPERAKKRPTQRARITPIDRETRTAKIPKLQLPLRWNLPLLFPFDGPKQAVVDWEDLHRLNEEVYLNDNLINFYMRSVCFCPVAIR